MAPTSDSSATRAVARFAGTVREVERMFGAGILIAVSGGPDSTALARLFQLARDRRAGGLRLPPLSVGHVHHGIRGPEADDDARFVERLASACGMEFICGRVDAPAEARRRGLSLEATARVLRYELLEEWACSRGLGLVATGHTADDQEETVLLRVARGCGFRGLGGIPRLRRLGSGAAFLHRPLLEWRRTELLDLLRALGQDFRRDSTNADVRIPRNALRHVVMPALRERVHGGVSRSLLRLAVRARELAADLEAWADEKEPAVRLPAEDGPRGIAYSLDAFGGLPASLREIVLRRGIDELTARTGERPTTLGASQLEEILRRLAAPGQVSAESAGVVELAGGWRLRIDGPLLRLEAERDSPVPDPPLAASDLLQIEVPGAADWHGWRISVELVDALPRIPQRDHLREVVDAAKLSRRLFVRSRRQGESFHPLGAPGRKKLKEYLRECGVPSRDRDLVPLLATEDEIVWVVGRRLAHPFRITDATRSWGMLTAVPPGRG